MKPIRFAVMAATILSIASCGISEKEKTALLQAQQTKDDSVRLAQLKQVEDADSLRVAQIKHKEQVQTLKAALGDSLAVNTKLFSLQQNAMIQLRTNIYTASDEMAQIKAFHLGRLPKDKEDEIRNQEVKIQSLIMAQTNLQTAMQTTNEKIRTLKTALEMSK